MTRFEKLTILSALYLAQGLPYGFFTQALPVLLRTANLSLPAIGLANLLTLPWALKFIWAPAADRYHFKNLGLRKSWLLPIQTLSILLYASLGFLVLGSSELKIVLAAFLFTNLLAASQDVATDGLAVDILEPAERGWGNGIQVAGYRIGMIIGGGALLAIYPTVGWSGVMFAMAAFAFICTLPVLVYKEPLFTNPPTVLTQKKSAAVFKEMVHFFFAPGAKAWLIVLLLYKFGHASASFILRPWLVDQGYAAIDIAKILGGGAFVAGFLGAMGGGWLSARFAKDNGRPKLLILLGVLQMCAVASYLWPVMSGHAAYKVLIAASLDHFTSGLATTVLFTMMMDACSKERAASDYTAQACVIVISQSLAATIGGFSADYFGYTMHFALSTFVGLVAVLLTAFLISRKAVREFILPKPNRLFTNSVVALAVFIGLALTPWSAQAQDSSQRATQISIQGGPLLAGRKVRYIREVMTGIDLGISREIKAGFIDVDVFSANGSGDKYRTASVDYRGIIWDDAFPAHASIGFHADQILPEGHKKRIGTGFHFGGGMTQPLFNGLSVREDFKYRAGGGNSLLVLIGLSYEFDRTGR